MLMGFDKQCAKAAHDVRNKPVQFDGNLLHFTQAFDGERYAIIFFCQGRGNERTREIFAMEDILLQDDRLHQHPKREDGSSQPQDARDEAQH